jgi:hypothetical protein
MTLILSLYEFFDLAAEVGFGEFGGGLFDYGGVKFGLVEFFYGFL